MSATFDFDKYYSIEKLSTDASINRAGVELQNPTETADIPTNNVKYYVSEVSLIYVGNFVGELDGNKRLIIQDIKDTEKVYFIRPWHPLGSLVETGIDSEWNNLGPGRMTKYTAGENDQYAYYLVDDDENDATRYQVKSFIAKVFPRYEAESGNLETVDEQIRAGFTVGDVDQSPITDPKLMKLLYGALGFYGGRWKGNKWLNKWRKSSVEKLGSAVIGYDTFQKKLSSLGDLCAESDVGMTVTYYEDSDALTEDGRDPYDANLSRSASFNDAYGSLQSFLSRPSVDIAEVKGETATALIPPVKEAVRSFFYPVDELCNEFNDLFIDTARALCDVPVVWSLISASKKNKINALLDRYRNSQAATPTDADVMLFDLDCMLNGLNALPSLPEVDYMPNCNIYPRLITRSKTASPEGNYIIGALPYPSDRTSFMAWNQDEISDDAKNSQLGYYMYYDNPEPESLKQFRTCTADEINDILISYYNSAYASRFSDQGIENASKDYIDIIKNGRLDDTNTSLMAFAFFYQPVAIYMNKMRSIGKTGDAEHISFAELWNALFASGKPYADMIRGFDVVNYQHDVPRYLDGDYDIITWADSSIVGYIKDGNKPFVAAYSSSWKNLSANPDLGMGYAVAAVNLMKDIYKSMYTAIASFSILLGPAMILVAETALDDLEEDIDRLSELAAQLLWYQRYVQESPFTNLSLIPDTEYPNSDLATWTMPARLMFPVSMYKKVRVKYKNWLGLTRHKTVKRSIGVRWAEVTFYDTSVYSEYPQVTEEAGEDFELSGRAEISGNDITLTSPLPEDALGRGDASLVVHKRDGTDVKIRVSVDTDITLTILDDQKPIGNGSYALVRIRVPLAPSQPEIGREPVNIEFHMPALPYDSEIRQKAFADYGAFSYAEYFAPERYSSVSLDELESTKIKEEDAEHHDGWKVFHRSSDSLENLREGMGLHDKVAMLVKILQKEFGDSRVQLVETYRSLEDQKPISTGGPESYFLSWHNYGLAAKILVLQEDGRTPIEKDGPEMKRMIPIAKAFEECCRNGGIGAPCNVVWCARLVVGPSMFDWEFLPIGVGHKDAPKFRDALLSQKDPVKEFGYVDVDAAGYVYSEKPADDNVPYVLASSGRYRDSLVIGGNHYMSPEHIHNYKTPNDITMYDVKEYVNLVNLKMNANGTGRVPGRTIYEWKMLNDDSAWQLVRYYAMIGSISSAKALLAGDYVEKFGTVDNQMYPGDPVGYIQGMLGEHYYDIRIYVPRDGKSSYITLHNGRYHMVSRDAYPVNKPTRLDLHKQQQVDTEHIKWGSWHDGIFYSEDERPIPEIVSEIPVIDGYDADGVPIEGEAMYLHRLVADKVHKCYAAIRDTFEGFSGALMYDHIENGPNASMVDMLENEFGLIKAQDLLSFDELERMLSSVAEDVQVDGTIYEKVVNNAQLAGIRKASLTKEHIHIKDTPTKSDAKTLYDLMQRGKGYMANDLLK